MVCKLSVTFDGFISTKMARRLKSEWNWVLETLLSTLNISKIGYWCTIIFFKYPVLAHIDHTLIDHNECRLDNFEDFVNGWWTQCNSADFLHSKLRFIYMQDTDIKNEIFMTPMVVCRTLRVPILMTRLWRAAFVTSRLSRVARSPSARCLWSSAFGRTCTLHSGSWTNSTYSWIPSIGKL